MTNQWRHLPAPARPVADAATRAVLAAGEQDPDALHLAVAGLAAQEQGQVGLILGTSVRLLLEVRNPDGLDADDVRAVLAATVRGAAGWCADVDPQVVLYLLANALGVWEDDGSPPPKPEPLALHAALLIEQLLAAPMTMPRLMTATLDEIQRAQLND